MQAQVDRKSRGSISKHLSSTLQAAKQDVRLAVAVEEDSGSPLMASSAEFHIPGLLGALRKMAYPGHALLMHFKAVLIALRT